MKTPHKLDRTRQAAPQVFEWLRASILSLQLAPGTALSRTELAERFELRQTPVRDALLQLAQEGLVDIFPQHATLVSRIDIASATQAHFLRCAIELEVVRTLALAAAEDTAVLRAKLAAQIDLQKGQGLHQCGTGRLPPDLTQGRDEHRRGHRVAVAIVGDCGRRDRQHDAGGRAQHARPEAQAPEAPHRGRCARSRTGERR